MPCVMPGNPQQTATPRETVSTSCDVVLHHESHKAAATLCETSEMGEGTVHRMLPKPTHLLQRRCRVDVPAPLRGWPADDSREPRKLPVGRPHMCVDWGVCGVHHVAIPTARLVGGVVRQQRIVEDLMVPDNNKPILSFRAAVVLVHVHMKPTRQMCSGMRLVPEGSSN